MLNGFCPLSEKKPTPWSYRTIKMDRILTKLFYIVFQVLKVLLIKICKIQSLDLLFLVMLFLLATTSVFRISFNIIWQKDFRHKFSFSKTDSLKLPPNPQPLNSKNLLSMTNFFCQCSVKSHFFKIIMLWWH